MPTTTSQPVHGIRGWSKRYRPRERLLLDGAVHLSAAELLGVCIGSGRPGADAVWLGQHLLNTFGDVRSVLAAEPRELLAVPGLGAATVARFKAIHELQCRSAEDEIRDEGFSFSDVSTVSEYLQRRLGHFEREVFGCLFLDTRYRLLGFEPLFLGSVNRTHVHAREVLKRGLSLNSAALILAHNHPSGNAEPSHADLKITRELKDLLARVDIQVLDHIVVARDTWVSLAARGLL